MNIVTALPVLAQNRFRNVFEFKGESYTFKCGRMHAHCNVNNNGDLTIQNQKDGG